MATGRLEAIVGIWEALYAVSWGHEAQWAKDK